MRRHAKAPSAGSTSGIGSSRRPFGRAFATCGASCDADGSGASSHHRLATLLLVAVAFAVPVVAPAAASAVTSKGVTGFYGAAGTAAGQMSTPRGVAVNQGNGNVYAVDGANNRVVEFNANGEFLRAFGQDVVLSGPGQANEAQSLDVNAASGNFTLTFNGQTTAPLAATASPAEVQVALNALSTIGGLSPAGSVTVTGGTGNAGGTSPYKIVFGGSLAATNVAQVTAANVTLSGGSPATAITAATVNEGATGFEICVPANGDSCKIGIATPTSGNGGQLNSPQGIAVNQSSGDVYVTEEGNRRVSQFSENGAFIRAFGKDVVATGFPGNVTEASAVQTLTIPGTVTGGKYTLEFATQKTAEIPYNASATEVQTALRGLSSIGPVGNTNVNVTGPVAGVYTVTFASNLEKNPEPLIVAATGTVTPLEGVGTATVTNTTTGSNGSEVCTAANNDVCKQAAAAAAAAGNFGATIGYPTVAPVGANNAGDVLVADPANLRVQEFGAEGTFKRAFGWNVVKAGLDDDVTPTINEFEVCSITFGDACQVGAAGSGNGQFATATPTRVAEDASSSLYTVEPTTNFRVQKFVVPASASAAVTASGPFDTADLSGATGTAPTDVAVNPSGGNVLVNKGFAAGATPSCPITGTPSVAESRVVEVSSGGALETTAGHHGACAGLTPVNGLAVRGSSGNVYASSTFGESRLYVLNTGQPVAPGAGLTNISGITAHSATITGFVNPGGPAGLPYGLHTTYQVNYKRSADSTFIGIPQGGADGGHGTSNQIFNQILQGLEAGTSYDVQVVATKGFGSGGATTSTFSFTTEAAKPEVGIPSATTAATETGARAALWGSVNPNSQTTTYRFEYGATAAYGTNVPAPDQSIGSGATTVPVAQYLAGLQSGTTYHFRIVAKNPTGSAASPDRTFTTPPAGSPGDCPNEAIREEQNSTFLPDCRGFEMVSPVDKQGSGFLSSGASPQVSFGAGPNGDKVLYPLQGGFSDSTAGGYLREQANRTPQGWLSEQISGASLIPPPYLDGFSFGLPSRTLYVAPDLRCAIVESSNPLTEDTPHIDVEEGATNLYRRNADGSFDLISDIVPTNPRVSAFSSGGLFDRVEASENCSQIHFRSRYEFIPGANVLGTGTQLGGLYEWDGGTIRDAALLPDGSIGVLAVPGGEAQGSATDRWNATAPDGTFFFTATSTEGADKASPAIFMREGGGTRIVDISKSQTSAPTKGARYEGASLDGGVVLFRANYGIAATGSAGPRNEACGPLSGETVQTNTPPLEVKPCDLYAYDVASGDLTDLSADSNAVDPIGAAIQGAVGMSDDGSYVYFAALGQLVPGKGRTYAQNVAGEGSANVYLTHDGQISYVMNLTVGSASSGDLFGGFEGNGVVMHWSNKYAAQVSADGHDLVFEASGNVAGYESGGGRAVYRSSVDTGGISCVSCPLDGSHTLTKPSGQTTDARFDSPKLLPPLYGASAEFGTASTNRSAMSADGDRIFFTSSDALLPGAQANKRNVYEWENGRLYFLANAERGGTGGIGPEVGRFVGTSTSGDDVFLASSERLALQDRDGVSDIYDIRVGGGFAVQPELPTCQVDESVALVPNQTYCQGATAPRPPSASPASSSFRGTGNPPVPASKKPHRKKHKARTKHRAHKGHANKRAAKVNRGGAK